MAETLSVHDEVTIEDWSWSQVPPPLLCVGALNLDDEHVRLGVIDAGEEEWTMRRLTPDQADELAEALHARAAAIRGAR